MELQLRRAGVVPRQHDSQQGGRPQEGRRPQVQLRHGAADSARHRVRGLRH